MRAAAQKLQAEKAMRDKCTPAPVAPAAARPPPTKPRAPALSTSNRAGAPPAATTEELQMLAAARELQTDKVKRDKWAARLDKVLADTGTKLPARSMAQLTVPKEFGGHVHEDPRQSLSSCEEDAETAKPIAQKVKEFTKTPKRFRATVRGEPRSPPSAPRSLQLTHARSFSLLSDARAAARPTESKSTVERELEYIRSVGTFKAKPVSRRVLESAGDLGVPRVQRRNPTEPKEFNLSQTRLPSARRAPADDDSASDAGSTQSAPAYPGFKARPFNKSLMEGRRAGLAQPTPRKPTRPRSPKLSTSARASLRPESESEPEVFAAFKARPMPDHAASPLILPRKLVAPRPVTSPKPFALTSVARHEVFEESRQRQLEEERLAAEQARLFKARPMPISEGWKPEVDTKHNTDPKPFDLAGEMRSSLHKQQMEAKLREAEAAAAREREFKAREPKVGSLDVPACPPPACMPTPHAPAGPLGAQV